MQENQVCPRGYDDTAYLSEMSKGIVSRRFTSVDEAARTVLGEKSGSNVDRLRRKFRDQKWYERGLQAYVAEEIERQAKGASCAETPENRAADETVLTIAAWKRWRRYASACVAAILGTAFATFAVMMMPAQAAWVDSRDVAKRQRAITFAESSFKGLHDLTFTTTDEDVAQAVRYFLGPAAYTSYVNMLSKEGRAQKVRDNQEVLRSETVGEPEVYGSPERGYTILFKVIQTTSTAFSGRKECLNVRSFVVTNDNVGFGASEFGLMGPPIVETSEDCG